MDGYQVLEQLRADPRLKSIPVVALSADAMPHDVQRGLAAGFDRYVAKPVDLNELLGVLNALMRRGRTPPSPP
jgi:CheY-like chemotaxis protein